MEKSKKEKGLQLMPQPLDSIGSGGGRFELPTFGNLPEMQSVSPTMQGKRIRRTAMISRIYDASETNRNRKESYAIWNLNSDCLISLCQAQ